MTSEHIERYIYSLPVSPRTKAVELLQLRGFFKFLTRQKRLFKENPCARVDCPKWQERYRPAVSRIEFEAVCRACRTIEEAAVVETLFFTGLRISELRSLRVRQVDFQTRQIRVIGKGGKERVVVFPERVVTVLRQHLGDRVLNPDGYLFPSNSPHHVGSPRGKQIGVLIKNLGKRAGLPYTLTAHLFRHGWVRLMKVSGVPVEVTARLAGHSSIPTTSRLYGRLDVGDLQTSYDNHIQAGVSESLPGPLVERRCAAQGCSNLLPAKQDRFCSDECRRAEKYRRTGH